MNDHICQQIENSAHYRELVDKRQRFAFILSIIMLVIYVGFILLIAFAPHWLGHSAARGDQRDARYSDWHWRDCDFILADRRLRLARER
ncbi:putative inner membrane protein [Enterobacter asburiae]|uniref:Putative inner membrane protein n=1 Tax=Enterobacter asburiae TaxID=61645 RepID=A0A376FIK3_ENTAS|nr:putative inner membrane protein [Enterobacter asburiae]